MILVILGILGSKQDVGRTAFDQNIGHVQTVDFRAASAGEQHQFVKRPPVRRLAFKRLEKEAERVIAQKAGTGLFGRRLGGAGIDVCPQPRCLPPDWVKG